MNVYWIYDTIVLVENEDGSWSEADNGEGVDGLSYEEAVELALMDAQASGANLAEVLKNLPYPVPTNVTEK